MAGIGFGGSRTTSTWNKNRVDPFYGYGQLDQSGMAGLMGGEQAGTELLGQGVGNMAQSLAAYNAMAAGEGPSLAQNLARQQTATNIASQQAMMAQGRGGSAAGQQRAAALAGQGLQAQSNADVAGIRAQEQIAAMGGAAQLGSQMAGLGAQQQLGYAGMLNDAQISQMNTAAQFQMQQRALQDQERNSRAQRRMGWANFGLNAGGTVIGAILKAISDERLKENIQPAGAGARFPTIDQRSAGPRYSAMAALSPEDAAFERADMLSVRPEYGQAHRGRLLAYNAPTSGGGSGMPAAPGMDGFRFGMEQIAGAASGRGDRMGEGEGLRAMGDSGKSGGLLSGLLSDERQKQGMQGGGPSEASALAGSMQPYTFDYRPGSGGPPGRRLGVMAQDLEQSPLGAQLVLDTPQGKQIDVAQAQGAALAMIADQEQRLRRLEGQPTAGEGAPRETQVDRNGVARVPRPKNIDPQQAQRHDPMVQGGEHTFGERPASMNPAQRSMYNDILETQERTTYLDEGGVRRLRDQAIGPGHPFEGAYIAPSDREAIASGEELAAREAERADHDARLRADARALARQIRKLPRPMQDALRRHAREAVIADEINRLRQITEAAGQFSNPDRRI